MATFYASTSGSNTAPYDTWAKAATSIQTAINAMNADGDEVIVDDETWVISTALTTNTFTSAPLNGSSLTIQSRSGSTSVCILSSDQVDKSIIDFDQAVRILDITFSGFGLTKSVTHTATATAAIASTSGQEGDITFDNCKIYDVGVTYSGVAPGSGPIVRCAGPARLVSFIGCTFDNITIAANGGGTSSVLISSGSNPNLLFSGCSFTNSTFNQTGVSSINIGWVYAKNALTINNITLDSLTSTKQAGSTGIHRPFFYAEDTILTLTIDGANVTNLDWVNGGISGVFAMASGPYDVKNINVSLCTAVEPTVNFLGCAFYAFGPSADGTYSDSVVHDCSSAHGSAFYAGQGGNGTLTNITAYNNVSVGRAGIEAGAGGAIYCGGWGDVTINYSLIYNNTADEGGGIYAHIHPSLSTRSKTTTVNNCTIYGNTATGDESGTGGNGALLRATNATYSHTVNIINTISFNGGVDELYGDDAGGTLVFTVDHCDVNGGAAAVTGEDTYTNNINSDPLFASPASSNFQLTSSSPCRDTGVDVGLTNDIIGRPVPIGSVADMGAYEFSQNSWGGSGTGGSLSLNLSLRV